MFPLSRIILTLICVFSLSQAFAFSISPPGATIASQGSNSQFTFQVFNPTNKIQAIEFTVKRLASMKIDGKEELVDANQDFVIYPRQLIVKPKQRKALRVSYNGSPNVKKEIVYRLISKEKTIDFQQHYRGSRPSGGLGFAQSYAMFLFVRPNNVMPDPLMLTFEKSEYWEDKQGDAKLGLTFSNPEDGYVYLPTNMEVHLEDGEGKKVVLTHKAGLSGLGRLRVLGGHTRRYFFEWPEKLKKGPVMGTMVLK